MDRQTGLVAATLAERRADALTAPIEEREFRHGLLLLAFLAENVLAAIFDALALVGLRLAPTPDLGGQLADLLAIDARNLDRGLIRGLHLQAFRHGDVHVVAVAELQTQVLALGRGAIADAGDLEGLREALGHARHQVLHQSAMHAPEGTRPLGLVCRFHDDPAVLDAVADVLEHRHGQRALRPLDRQHDTLGRGRNAARQRDRYFSNAAHDQNTSASTPPPTFWSRASA